MPGLTWIHLRPRPYKAPSPKTWTQTPDPFAIKADLDVHLRPRPRRMQLPAEPSRIPHKVAEAGPALLRV